MAIPKYRTQIIRSGILIKLILLKYIFGKRLKDSNHKMSINIKKENKCVENTMCLPIWSFFRMNKIAKTNESKGIKVMTNVLASIADFKS